MPPQRIAILGATSHIAKGLIVQWSAVADYELALYARSPELVDAFLRQTPAVRGTAYPIEQFGLQPYDLIINCIGLGSPQKLANGLADIFRITSQFDDLVLACLDHSPQTLYVSLSSGAAFGTDFPAPVDAQREARFQLNQLQSEAFYGIAKLHAEARHRALSHYNIVDLRIYGYFSRFIDLHERFLLSEALSCLLTQRTFITTSLDIVRDFIHPADLSALIICCLKRGTLNDAFDVCSRQASTKFELLNALRDRFGLAYEVTEQCTPLSATGSKRCYYSLNNRAATLGFEPAFRSVDTVLSETEALLNSHRFAPLSHNQP